ncbi:cation transporter [Promicromonospora sp. NPDC050249]|uniref:cation transporter n=1 Tax=Promicromonospora sp. NPDC050249 TaxID=3154743 RepID=UPI0033CB4E4B
MPARTPAAAATTSEAQEHATLLGSAVGGAVIALTAVVWGLLSGSGIILFDGIFAAAGIVLVAVSMLAAHAAGSEPTSRYPFGRHAATPLAVAMQGAALFATLAYGAAEATATLVAGGSDGDPVQLILYGLVAALGSWGLSVWVNRRAPDSGLALAEVVSWRSGAWLSLAIAGGGAVGMVLDRTLGRGVAQYVDPTLLLAVSVLLLPMPVRLIRQGMHELLEGAPDTVTSAQLADVIGQVRTEHDLPEPLVRASKVGRRLYVEVDFVVEPGTWSVDAEDDIRRAVVTGLEALPLDVWATVELTTDPDLAA